MEVASAMRMAARHWWQWWPSWSGLRLARLLPWHGNSLAGVTAHGCAAFGKLDGVYRDAKTSPLS